MTEHKKKILWLSDGALLTTGYATISRKLCNYLSDMGWEVHYLSHTGVQQTTKPGTKLEDDEEFKFTLHGSGLQPYCADIIMPKIRELKPDVFGVLLDTFMLYPWFMNLDFAPAKSVFYFPSDGRKFPKGCQNILRKVNLPIAMSKFAQKQVKDDHNVDSLYIPHAVETDVYKPLSEAEKLALRLNFKCIGPSGMETPFSLMGKFVIGCVARNQGRKMLDRVLPTMKIVAKEIPEAVLVLHTDPMDPASYFDFYEGIRDYGLQNRVVFTGTKYYKGFDYRKMNDLYNIMDLFYLPTSGEGFGIPTIEAMAASVPVLITDYTTTKEIVTDNKSGEAINLRTEILGTWGVFRGVCDFEDAAERIIKLYKDPALRKEYGMNGRSAVLKEYNWISVAKKFDEALTKLI